MRLAVKDFFQQLERLLRDAGRFEVHEQVAQVGVQLGALRREQGLETLDESIACGAVRPAELD